MERQRTVLSEINVTPFVDVMLVLLIIFMITAPFLQQGIEVNLPKAKGKDFLSEERIIVTIKKERTIYLNDNPISIIQMKRKLKAVKEFAPNVFLKADKDVPYGFVIEVISEIKDVGIEKLGMITEPKVNLK